MSKTTRLKVRRRNRFNAQVSKLMANTVTELRSIARRRGMKGFNKLRKLELARRLA